MLEINDLFVQVEGKEILKGVNLKIKPGETHALMGPNGSGKSSLSLTLLGHPRYQITQGKILLNKKDITPLSPDKRAKKGLFLVMQNPMAVPGVSVLNLMRSAYKNLYGKAPDFKLFLAQVRKELGNLKLDEKFLERSIHESFSGGEKKKVEILQLAVLKPKYLILDETDSGLDVDALKIVGQGIKANAGPKVGVLLITHYQRLLKYIEPDFVHIMVDGKIVKSGTKKLAEEIEEKGYTIVKSSK